MARVDIVRRDDGTVEFQPSPITVQAGDTVFWRNLDPQEQHWITKAGKPRTHWFASPLAPFVPGQPGDTTSEVLFQNPGGVSYACDLHGEQGMVKVV